MLEKIKLEIKEVRVLLRSVPALVMTLFVMSVICMNLLANKSIDLNLSWLALDCGIIVSWLAFLSMDVITKRFGAKAAIQISVVASVLNLVMCGIFYIGKLIPGSWGESFIDVGGDIANVALDNTFGGTWYVLFGSTVAFLVSAAVNAVLNEGIGKILKTKNEFLHFSIRSYVSTMIGQFVDNLTFALIVSHFFFGWTLLQCVMCAFTGAIVELVCEVIFSPIGFRISKKWDAEGVGQVYLDYIKTK